MNIIEKVKNLRMAFCPNKNRIIVFIKVKGEWKLKKLETPFENTSDIEAQIRKMGVDDFKIWMIDNIGTRRCWNDINFYNPANFIYLPLTEPYKPSDLFDKPKHTKNWTWFNMDESIPYPKYLAYRFKPHFNLKVEEDGGYICFSFPDFSDNKYPISREDAQGVNQIEVIKGFLQKLKQNSHASCTVSGIIPYTFLAWVKGNEVRFQCWSYTSKPLFECKNGMELLRELKIDKDEFYSQFEKFLKV